MAYVKVFTGSLVAMQHIKQLMQDKNIEPIVKDRSNSAAMAGFGAVHTDFIELFVHEEEVEKAMQIIKKYH